LGGDPPEERSAMSTAVWTQGEARWAVISREAGLVVGLAGLTALAAKVAVPLPWTPVPATLQVAAVIFAGAAFGSRRGLLSQLVYLTAGLLGAPVFASWTLLGPGVVLTSSFGFLLAFPLAAWLAGRWTGRGGRFAGAGLALVAIHLAGGLWLFGWALAVGAPSSAGWVLLAGSLPFLPFDLLKAGLAVCSAAPIRRRWMAP
jgi:biotin transport system substrate-specific component